MTPNMKQETS